MDEEHRPQRASAPVKNRGPGGGCERATVIPQRYCCRTKQTSCSATDYLIRIYPECFVASLFASHLDVLGCAPPAEARLGPPRETCAAQVEGARRKNVSFE